MSVPFSRQPFTPCPHRQNSLVHTPLEGECTSGARPSGTNALSSVLESRREQSVETANAEEGLQSPQKCCGRRSTLFREVWTLSNAEEPPCLQRRLFLFLSSRRPVLSHPISYGLLLSGRHGFAIPRSLRRRLPVACRSKHSGGSGIPSGPSGFAVRSKAGEHSVNLFQFVIELGDA